MCVYSKPACVCTVSLHVCIHVLVHIPVLTISKLSVYCIHTSYEKSVDEKDKLSKNKEQSQARLKT